MSKTEHGTLASYVVGFILSLLFTAGAYLTVVNRTASGNVLLATILGFALLQMCVQIFFFLHLGRGPKPLYNVTFFVGTVGIILVVVLGSIFIMNNLHYNMSPSANTQKLAQDEGIAQVNGARTGACGEVHASHIVTMSGGKASPLATEGKLCDTLTFVNTDNTAHIIAFGQHDDLVVYGGVSTVLVAKGFPKTITLNQAGTYVFHDRFDTTTSGTFTVSP